MRSTWSEAAVKLSQFTYFRYRPTQPNLAGFFSADDRLSKIRWHFHRQHFLGRFSAAGKNSADPDIRRRLGTLAVSASRLGGVLGVKTPAK